ncbi:geranylgeranylglycerol-phosphate geranylgeranyltransferase [Wenyingzhuangia aestuarii]|uniref:geranylgeranylglycerol-phosphate geranylgeranyltransferase n=1 Tax=Wenyingzhuangia aestuarii TaxID=1647582 RepID=UPI00143B3C43|nr:geranylgeranylglycerol-phosphate geranylgeranyltransferase [Wenyingzhuangia aestuarii]NJB82848.1 4-hydroxybenzoate polyprenyltransferase [Wenyingzhuangia aestuarii]
MEQATTKKHKFLGLFSVIRGYNVALLTLAQYLAAIFVFAVDKTLKEVLLDVDLHIVVLATIFVVSAGYIINDFYDATLDAINKPIKTHIGNWVSKNTKLQVYFLFNFIAFVLGFIISWRAAAFFAVYIFLIWLYSHKLQKYPVVRVLSVSVLDVLPFFVVFVYFKNISEIILMHGAFLYGLILVKEIVKDFEKTKGALLVNRATLITKYGKARVNTYVYIILAGVVLQAYYLLCFPEIGNMQYYFYGVILWIPFFLFLLIKAKSFKHYLMLHNMLKVVLVVGVFSLALIDTSVLLIRILNQVKI